MNANDSDWSERRAPDLGAFEDMAQTAFDALPASFRNLCAGIVIRVDDWPDDETLDEMNCESDYDLLGLFRGRGLAQGEVGDLRRRQHRQAFDAQMLGVGRGEVQRLDQGTGRWIDRVALGCGPIGAALREGDDGEGRRHEGEEHGAIMPCAARQCPRSADGFQPVIASITKKATT